MKLKVLTVATNPDPGLDMLVLSLEREKYDYKVLGMGKEWLGFNMKFIEVWEWCKANKDEYTHIVFLDAYDTFAMGRVQIPDDWKGILFNGEKACWPDADKAILYPEIPDCQTPYKYLNTGAYLASVPELLDLFEKYPPIISDYDQRYMTDIYLTGQSCVKVDYNCEFFQTIAFFDPSDYKVDNLRLHNLYSDTCPVFIHGNGRTDMSEIYGTYLGYNYLEEVAEDWKDTTEFHQTLNDLFTAYLKKFSGMYELREFIETKIFGFGEKSFYYMWYLIIKALPERFVFLEVGVFRGQILALVRMISKLQNKVGEIYGLTPLDSSDGHWESDYAADIEFLHEKFDLHQPKIIKGLSTDKAAIAKATRFYDVVYIDGGHDYETVKSDLEIYSSMVKSGGYLVIDDSCNGFDFPVGYFAGLEDVTRATNEFFHSATPNTEFEFLFNVVHNRVYKKK